jgi:FMN phosphatase YigB (HAD superfamily)
MYTVWVAPRGAKTERGTRPNLRVTSLTELLALFERGVSGR